MSQKTATSRTALSTTHLTEKGLPLFVSANVFKLQHALSYLIQKHILQEVIRFFDLLMGSMGQNVKFIIEHVCEGDSFTAGVNWHLGNTIYILTTFS